MSTEKKDFAYFACQPYHYTVGTSEKTAFLEATISEWICRWHYRGNTRVLNCPAGYIWDGASVPRAGWTVIGITPGGLADGPSLAHDIPYRAKGGKLIEKMSGCTITDANGVRVVIDRDEADWLFRELCVFAGMNHVRANAAYKIVKTFGARHWGGPIPILRG